MVSLHISPDMVRKLREKHRVRRADVVEAFANRIDDGPVDDREQHRTDPPGAGSFLRRISGAV